MGDSSKQPSADCSCGMAVFDLTRRNLGDILECPWCKNRHRLLEGLKIEPYDGPDPSTLPPPDKQPEKKPDSKPEGDAAGTVEASKKKNKTVRLEDGEPSPKPKKKRLSMDDAPGGVGAMVGFIVASTAFALVALSFVLPKRPDGGRDTFWGSVISSKAIWPELAAIVVGHLIGLCVYGVFLHFMLKRQKAKIPDPSTEPTAYIAKPTHAGGMKHDKEK